jgi:hypothetical protein
MKKLVIAVMLMLVSSVAFSDVGLFLDGTSKYAKNGIIQSNFPGVPLYKCPNFDSCLPKTLNQPYVGVVFTDFPKMKAVIKKHAKDLESVTHKYKARYHKFKLNVYDVVALDGTSFVLVQVITGKSKVKNIEVAQALVAEFDAAYSRIGLGN